MPFARLVKTRSIGPRSPLKMGVRIGSRRPNLKSPLRQVYFSLSQELVDHLGWEIDVGENRIRIFVQIDEGFDTDSGWLSLREDKQDGFVFGSSRPKTRSYAIGGAVSMTTFRHYTLVDPDGDWPATPVEHIINGDGTIAVQCPEWLVPLAPKPAKPVNKFKPPAHIVDLGNRTDRRAYVKNQRS